LKLRGSLFFAGFFFGLIETFVVASQPFWVIEFFKPATQSTLNLIGEGFTITSLLIDPVAVFLAMFFMGERFDISFDFSSVLLSFVGGTVLGTYTCLFLISAYALSAGFWQPFEPQFELDLLYDGLGALRIALVGFSGLALAYFSRRHVSATRTSPT
jgi:hypothetical protein